MNIRAWTRCVCTLAVVTTLSLVTAPASAAVVDRLIVFGDSLSDTGNIHIATSGALPGAAYFNGRFSNGPVWVEHVAVSLGITPPAPTLLGGGGTNFAFAGGSTGAGNSAVGSPNLQTQLGLFAASGITPTDNDLFVIWAGANDFLIDGEDNPAQVVTRLMTSIQTLAATGARQILVANLPDLTIIPNADLPPTIFVPTPGNLATRTAGYNTLLAAALTDFAAANPGVELIQYDAAGFLDSILADPAAFGFTNVSDPAFNAATNTVVPNPDEFLFWDTVHISARTHQLLAQDILSTIIPEPTTALLLLGATTLALLRRPGRIRSEDQ